MNTHRSSQTRFQSRMVASTGERQRHFALRPLALALAAASMLSLPGIAVSPARAQAAALPSGLNVVAGQASAVVNGQQMTVTNSANSILNWQSFSIGSNNGVYFAQPNSASKVLNRVVGNDPSAILGSLGSNGQVWLLNPNGVLFGQGARVDVGGLVTSTLRLNDLDWLSGRYNFTAADSDPAAGVVNQGELRSSMGGRIALLGGNVRNEGLINAPDGQVMLAAGRSIELIDTGTPNLRLRVTAPDGEAMNLGTLAAPGGRIDVHAAMVNQQGIVRADGFGTNAAGEVVLQASNKLDLRAGSVTSASGAIGGKVTLDAGNGTAMLEGDVLATGTAGAGGQIKVLGSQVGVVGAARLDVSGRSGGEVLVGGGERGQDASVTNSRAVFVGEDASITADAQGQGNGGRIILWSDEATRAYGSFSARGGAAGGDGGFIETSGGWIDIRPARLDASAAAGLAGTWLLDPWDITISDSFTGDNLVNVSAPNPVTFTATGSPSQIRTASINTALNNGNSVLISTGSTGTESGDITLQRAIISAAPSAPVSLTLQAARNIDISYDSSITSTGAALSVNLNAAGAGEGSVSIAGPITTAGGNIFASGVGRASEGYQAGIGAYIYASLNAGAGNITLIGDSKDVSGLSSGRSGISLSYATLSGRDISLSGSHPGVNLADSYGVYLYNATVTATHSLALRGTS
ncbi:MAG: filamentous hemagglutinin N-terminal domain-containing protein, partial [Ideonella sp.]